MKTTIHFQPRLKTLHTLAFAAALMGMACGTPNTTGDVAGDRAIADVAGETIGLDVGSTDSPSTDTPAADVPPTDGPAPDVVTMDSPVTDTPVVDVPRIDVPVLDTPVVDVPVVDVPVIDVPVADAGCTLPTLPTLRVTPIVTSGNFPGAVFVAQPPGSTDLFVVEQAGRIRIVRAGATLGTPFLDIAGRISSGGELGLLGLAFHPMYATNRRFFVYYTAAGTTTTYLNIVAEYRAMTADVADPAEVRRLIAIPDRESNHNGGMITFGPGGFLFVGTGDEGGGGDMHGANGNAQNRMVLHGKILRLDVDNVGGGFAAAGNPFSGATGLPQIWDFGLRNPWRFSFDRATNDLFIGDVGQNRFEELDVHRAGVPGGLNFGWRAYEGDSVYNAGTVPVVTVHTPPILPIAQAGGPIYPGGPAFPPACSVMGGYVYRGAAIPALVGTYVFSDYCWRTIAALRYCGSRPMNVVQIPGLNALPFGTITSFGEDIAGELYVVRGGATGMVYRIGP